MLSHAATLATAVWRRVAARLGPAPIATADDLKRFLEERALLVAQKCAIDYCRGKTGLASYALFTEKPFLDALEVCRWEGFTAVLSDLLILAESALRLHATAGERPRLREALAGLHAEILDRLPAPAYLQQGWSDARAAFSDRFAHACRGELQGALAVADHSAKRLFDTLPIHKRMRALDEEVIYGAVRFRMIAVNQELQRRLAPPVLIRQLVG